MGIFDKLKASVGIGQPDLSVTVENNQVHRGASIKGKITLTAKDKEALVNGFEVVFTQIIKESVLNEKKKTHEIQNNSVTLAKKQIPKGGQVLKATQSLYEDISIDISSDALPTGQTVSYFLHVTADISGLDTSENMEIYVV
jgi:sporulation-control protein spo0M